MTSSPTASRPPQVTLAGWLAVMSGSFLVMGMFERIGGLRSIENRAALEECLEGSAGSSQCGLTRPIFVGLGLDVDGALSLLQTVLVVTGGLAAAAAVLGWFVLQRHKPSRVALSAVAVPLFVAGFASAGFLPVIIAVAALLLWTGPARDWFAGRPVRQPALLLTPPAPPRPPVRPDAPPPAPGSRISGPHLPPVPPGVASDSPPPYAGFGAPRPGVAGRVPAVGRPPALLAAAVITWITSATVFLVLALSVFLVLSDRSAVDQIVEQEPLLAEMSTSEIRTAVAVVGVLFAGWALAAATLALLVMLRVSWARPVLIVSAILSGLLSCVMAVAIFPVVTAVAGMVTAYLLLRPEIGAWINRR